MNCQRSVGGEMEQPVSPFDAFNFVRCSHVLSRGGWRGERGTMRDRQKGKGKKRKACCRDVWGAGLKWHSTHLPFVSPSLCVLQMLGRTRAKQRGAFSRLCPSTVSAARARPPRIAPTVASLSAPPITSRSTCGYTQVSMYSALVMHRSHLNRSQLNIYCTSCKIYLRRLY